MVQETWELGNGVEQEFGARCPQAFLGRKAAENCDRADPGAPRHFQIVRGVAYVNARGRIQAHLL
jgi:hypothetical protein